MKRLFLCVLLCLATRSSAAQPNDLLISEYVEGNGFNKALELFNGTGTAVDLTLYALELYSNGSSTPSHLIGLSGMLAPGEVYVLAHPSADGAVLAQADVTSSSVINFNGDDAVVLRSGGALVDVLGQIGVDPGSAWGSGATSTANNTLRRIATDCTADIDASDASDPAAHYEGVGPEAFEGLGAHTAACTSSGGQNAAPVFTATLADTLVDDGAMLLFAFMAADADGDDLSYTLTAAPAGAQINACGTFTWSAGPAGVYRVTATVSDGAAATSATAYVGVRGALFPGEEGAALRQSLRSTFTPSLTLGYHVARDTLYAKIDRDPNGLVRGVYTGFGVSLPDDVDPSSYLAAHGINAEHTWPQSMGAGDEPGRSDMHSLFPSKDNVNMARSNKPFADIPDHQTETWYRLNQAQTAIPTSEIDQHSESADGSFEPREMHKGNAARASLYFFTIYETVSDVDFLLEMCDVLVSWNTLDPPDGAEIGRTGRIADRQGNVNPFLLDPTLAERAVSDMTPPSPPTPIGDGRTDRQRITRIHAL